MDGKPEKRKKFTTHTLHAWGERVMLAYRNQWGTAGEGGGGGGEEERGFI